MHALVEYGYPSPSLPSWAKNVPLRFERHIGYKIGTLFYSLLDIEYGILRASLTPPTRRLVQGRLLSPLFLPKFAATDPRRVLIPSTDPRVVFVLCNGTASSPQLRIFDVDHCQELLTQCTQSYLKKYCRFDYRLGTPAVSPPRRIGSLRSALSSTNLQSLGAAASAGVASVGGNSAGANTPSVSVTPSLGYRHAHHYSTQSLSSLNNLNSPPPRRENRTTAPSPLSSLRSASTSQSNRSREPSPHPSPIHRSISHNTLLADRELTGSHHLFTHHVNTSPQLSATLPTSRQGPSSSNWSLSSRATISSTSSQPHQPSSTSSEKRTHHRHASENRLSGVASSTSAGQSGGISVQVNYGACPSPFNGRAKTHLVATVPELLEWFRADFGRSDRDLMRWFASQHWDSLERSRLSDFASGRDFVVEFTSLDWSPSVLCFDTPLTPEEMQQASVLPSEEVGSLVVPASSFDSV